MAVTPGAKRRAYIFEHARYPDLEAFAADLTARMLAGVSAIVAGRLKLLSRTIHRDEAYPRDAKHIADQQSWLLALDFDGLASTKAGAGLDRPEDFSDAVLAEIRKRLPPAFKSVDCLLVATASTGLPVDSKGEPANGRARFRAIFLLSRPLFFAEQRQIVIALREGAGLDCLDLSIYSVSQFTFVARPKFPDGMTDSIHEPVLLRKGGQSQVDVDALETQIDVTLTPKVHTRPVSAEERLLDVDPAVRHELIERLVGAIPNDTEEHGGDWIAVMHGTKGASGDPHWGKHLWLEFCARWTKGKADEEEDERVWQSAGLDHGNAGIGTLLRLAWRAATPEAIAAVEAVR